MIICDLFIAKTGLFYGEPHVCSRPANNLSVESREPFCFPIYMNIGAFGESRSGPVRATVTERLWASRNVGISDYVWDLVGPVEEPPWKDTEALDNS